MMDESLFSAFDAFDFENDVNFQRGWKAIQTVVDSEAVDVEYMKAKAFFFSKYIKPIDLEQYRSWKSDILKNQNEVHTSQSGRGDLQRCKDQNVAPERDLLPPSSKPNPELNYNESSKTGGRSISEPMERSVKNSITDSNSSDHEISNCEYQKGKKEGEEIEARTQLAENIKKAISDMKDKDDHKEAVKSGQEDSLSLTELAFLVQNGLPIPGLISVDIEPTNKDPTPSTMARKPKPWEIKNLQDEKREEALEENTITEIS